MLAITEYSPQAAAKSHPCPTGAPTDCISPIDVKTTIKRRAHKYCDRYQLTIT
ncbi:hypothetical protein GNIT_3638 [Glaciecola nitratireducens FR1064]|uniref:Uncharacterized protein n=1 Tax=Glaciecola nitratireducens (strain JCM 12485 / KCTC 12276 / FR1064) TaxID=1085623 RepID=G4QP24_GLANF|nr:hypothetical protein GNIT_3638 [Glaciecola nitratireducens FR1064]